VQVHTMKFLDETAALDMIRALLDGSDRARLAVAFWGKGAIGRLGLDRPGLSLEILCNLDSGACNPAELRQLLGRPDVTLRSHPALHAKVYWTPAGAVLGSSNASANGLALESDTATGWHEANVAVDHPAILADIDYWFTTLSSGGYAITSDDLDRATAIWKSRARQAPTGRRLPSTLSDAWRSAPDHPAWKKVKLVWWRDDLEAKDAAWLEKEMVEGRLGGGISAYRGWGDRIAKGDLLIDFDISGRKPAFTGIWQVLSQGGNRRLQLVTGISRIAIPGLGQFALSPAEREALGAIAPAAIERYADDGRNAVIGFSQAMAFVASRGSASLARDFDRAMQQIYDEAATFGYRPNLFRRMLAEHGGLETARRLVHGSATSGFETLWEHKRLDLSVEALILDRRWRALFTTEELAIARKRLSDFDYTPDE